MRIRAALTVALAGILVFCLTLGCGKGSGPAEPPPPVAGSGEALYRIKSPEKTVIALERGKKRAEVPVPPEYKIYDQDLIENKGDKPAVMHDLQQKHTFNLAPGARLKIGSRSITMFFGSTKYEFENIGGEFHIVLPKATLGIKGTRFQVDVAENGNAKVELFEGRLAIECQGKITMMESGSKAEIDDSPTPVRLTPSGGTLTTPDPGEEDIQRNRKSTY